MTDIIAVKIKMAGSVPVAAVVRRVTLDARGCVDHKAALSKDGEWIVVPEGTSSSYPAECLLPIADYTRPCDFCGEGDQPPHHLEQILPVMCATCFETLSTEEILAGTRAWHRGKQ